MTTYKYVKVMFGTTSGAKSDFEYKVNEINVSNNWNTTAEKGRDFGETAEKVGKNKTDI